MNGLRKTPTRGRVAKVGKNWREGELGTEEKVTLAGHQYKMPLEFDPTGNLKPYGLIESSLVEFEAFFVNGFTGSGTRRGIFDEYLFYITRLRDVLGDGFVQWVDGSFTTGKINPRDIDFGTFVGAPVYDQLLEPVIENFQRLRRGGRTDGYFVRVLPENHRERFHYESDRVAWLHRFGLSRKFESKGIVQLYF